MNELLIGLSIFTIVREIYFQYTINKLINKLMSRSFYDYNISQEVVKRGKDHKPTVKEDTSLDEDLGVLQGIG